MKKIAKTFEPQYNWQLETRDRIGGFKLGLTAGSTYFIDPKRLVFTLSRYKFAAKLLRNKKSVLEIGCGDGFASRILMQHISKYTGIDADPVFVSEASGVVHEPYTPDFYVHDITVKPFPESFDSAVSLDVLEHIPEEKDSIYFSNICESMTDDGIFVCGMPSLESQCYASFDGAGHINCKTAAELNDLCKKYFSNVLMFSMNDEMVHTGFEKMAHYLFAVCIGPK